MNKSLVSELRKKRFLTQENLADEAHVTVRTIQRIEVGEEVSKETLKCVSNALGVTVNELFESVESKEKEVEIMELSQEQELQINYRKNEMFAIRLFSIGVIFFILAFFAKFISTVPSINYREIYGIIWVSILVLSIAFLKYFLSVFISKNLDKKYPLTVGIKSFRSAKKNKDFT
ncbi:helix-turn-helix domain-containing protein [Macrococcoides caseolyticum]|uniref:helix-turn-helix domain-containing protein n=1 Tax=Macrococcoides caseolyticum TaxID=69966 RepID=UPI000C325126|nr:helix-turn-helix transcriptional regulator [Macrococcus caseolyticus]PKE47787.1 DNA-binding protein [Macrococcus caseolyticus]